jgi:hypothetical protein
MANRVILVHPYSGANQIKNLGLVPVDAAGVAVIGETVYVADRDAHVIYKGKVGGTFAVWIGSAGVQGDVLGQGGTARLRNPSSLAVDSAGFLYVVDAGNNKVKKIDQNGNVFGYASIPAEVVGDEHGQICVDAAGRVFLIDNN